MDPERFVDAHEGLAEIQAGNGFDVVGDDGRALSAVGPEPNEWDFFDTGSLHERQERGLKELFHCDVERPLGKQYFIPPAQIEPLSLFAQGNGQ